jgi:histone deacetylase complex subunit SAP18
MASMITSSEDKPVDKTVDREKTCPLLLRVFVSKGRPHAITEYNPRAGGGGSLPPSELQIYTWLDATLDEMSSLVKEVHPEAKRKGTTFDFRLVYPDLRSNQYRFREIGSTTSGKKGPDDHKSLASVRFVIGDYLDIHVVLPSSRMSDGRDHRRDERGDIRRDDRGHFRGLRSDEKGDHRNQGFRSDNRRYR